jgi:phage terminase large subunit GpA-like protein
MVKGAAAPYFVRIHSRPNHALDARIYALAALETLPNIAWDKIRANFAKPPVGAEPMVGDGESGIIEEEKPPQTVAVAPQAQTVAPTKPAMKPFGVPRRILPGRGWLPPR